MSVRSSEISAQVPDSGDEHDNRQSIKKSKAPESFRVQDRQEEADDKKEGGVELTGVNAGDKSLNSNKALVGKGEGAGGYPEVDDLDLEDAKDAVDEMKKKTNIQSIIAMEEKVNYDKLMAYIE